MLVVRFGRNRLRLHTRVNQIKHSPIFKLQGVYSSRHVPGAIMVSKDKYVLDSLGEYMCHSLDPSCEVVGKCVFATRDLSPGEELTIIHTPT